MSSAGNTRGLIEAETRPRRPCIRSISGLPRGIPAASLKLRESQEGDSVAAHRGLPRGIPAASLKRRQVLQRVFRDWCLPRGIPAASLKPSGQTSTTGQNERLPRGIPAASLKLRRGGGARQWRGRLPRGIPAASLKHAGPQRHHLQLHQSSAGNTRGLIEASATHTSTGRCSTSSAGNTRGLIEAEMRIAIFPLSRWVFRGEYPRPH